MELMQSPEFTDYEGPTGLYVATGETLLALDSAEGLSALAQSTMLSALGTGEMADQYAVKVAQSLRVAHKTDLTISE